ncbi:SDR family NAD(P)-dependent oxidoreductase [Paraburkholderia phenoliruptrix]|uniref:SDR family NAD(P)-dependent oxidoreductase n=1 Tax=Paraburkholderia phenoliruptrix TaxID=252970 RepID=UPI0001C028ED|nr:SDR family NAD(P)-dependent oxidoreductase [Paraburkholderia phenoliruptrix]WMY11860.1 SDR family NAD(P)-dependent oxidoreductase [Paraburkholderia phenoliruptrix]
MVQVHTSMREVAGKVAFITGGSSGIGLGIARAFINAGMKVAFSYRTRAHLDRAMGFFRGKEQRVHAINVDVTDRPGMARAAEETVRRFGKVHVLVNNAAVGMITGLVDATFDDWDWVTGVNIDGVFNGIRAFLPLIRAHGEGGHVVSTSSMGGLVVAKGTVYSTTKFAVVGMMEGLRAELYDTNIGVSVYCPGGVNSNIRHSDRNRPERLSASGFTPASEEPAFPDGLRERYPDPGGDGRCMDPLEAGEWVLHGIRNNLMYILSHPEFEPTVRDRAEALLASFTSGGRAVPQARLDDEREILRPKMYVIERERALRSGSCSD